MGRGGPRFPSSRLCVYPVRIPPGDSIHPSPSEYRRRDQCDALAHVTETIKGRGLCTVT